MPASHVIDIEGVVTIKLSDEEPVFGLCAIVTATVPPNALQDDQFFASVAFNLVGTLDPKHRVLHIQGQLLPQCFILSKSYRPTYRFAIAHYFEGAPHAESSSSRPEDMTRLLSNLNTTLPFLESVCSGSFISFQVCPSLVKLISQLYLLHAWLLASLRPYISCLGSTRTLTYILTS